MPSRFACCRLLLALGIQELSGVRSAWLFSRSCEARSGSASAVEIAALLVDLELLAPLGAHVWRVVHCGLRAQCRRRERDRSEGTGLSHSTWGPEKMKADRDLITCSLADVSSLRSKASVPEKCGQGPSTRHLPLLLGCTRLGRPPLSVFAKQARGGKRCIGRTHLHPFAWAQHSNMSMFRAMFATCSVGLFFRRKLSTMLLLVWVAVQLTDLGVHCPHSAPRSELACSHVDTDACSGHTAEHAQQISRTARALRKNTKTMLRITPAMTGLWSL